MTTHALRTILLSKRVSMPPSAPTTANFCLFPTSLGACGVAWRGSMVIATRLPDTEPERAEQNLAKRTGGERGDPPDAIVLAINAMTSLLDGHGTDLGLIACDMHIVDPFARRVYEATRAIPAGQTRTYGSIAKQLGDRQLSRQVGRTLGRNPFPIIVPCHRVLGTGGKLTGFSAAGGIVTKLKMLEIEGAQIGQGAGLFDDLPLAVKPQ
ncbi:methylated-DNA--[protein]-cysteine S-methyltransferase [Oceaniradius stylonematis]|uniref:methylated-DNA--[protein]-cysteine S-methyltransferase n=1 Tax=Oceaniradius stylonematis TaxID=2184161 RepID=UPI003C79DBC6